jgi:hypothetical protein
MDNPSSQNPSLAWSLVTILTLLLVLAVIVIIFLFNQKPAATPASVSPPPAFIANITTPTPALIILNKSYTFPIQDGQGTKVGDIQFVLKDVSRTKEIKIGNQTATAVTGRELLLLDIELTNSQNLAAIVNARNYVRLKINGTDKLQAPDFHGDPVDLQPQSTQTTRLAFSIADTDANLVLQVGELTGSKDIFQLDL